MRKLLISRSILTCAALVIVGSSVNAAPPQYAPSYNSLRNAGNVAYFAKDFKKAEELDTRALETDFREPGAWGHRSLVRAALGDLDGALSDNSTYLAAQQVEGLGDDAQIIFNVIACASYTRNAQNWFKKGEMLRALADSIVAVKVDGKSSPAMLMRADTAYEFGNFADAQNYLKAARVLDPAGNITRDFTESGARQNASKHVPLIEQDNFRSQLAQIEAAKASVDGKEELRIYNEVLRTFVLNTGMWVNRGMIFAQAHQYDQAIADFSMAIDIGSAFGSPNTALALQNRAQAYNLQGKYAQAYIDFEYAHKLMPDDTEIVRQLGFVKLRFTALHLPNF